MTLRRFLKYTPLGRWIVVPYRLFAVALPTWFRQLGLILRWTFESKEHYNFTYHLTDLNRDYLISFTAAVTGHERAEIEGYFGELEADETLRQSLRHRALSSPDRHNSDVEPRYGRRIGWYALVRATKPRIILETGVDRGLGTAVLAAALKRNSEEGAPGRVYGTDIVPECGNLVAEPYKSYTRVMLGDSVESLKQFSESVDVFLHDSDHRPEYEWAEFLAIEPRLHSNSLVLSDNSQQTPQLLKFATRLGRSFLYFQDQPKDHWWPGDGIGVAFVPGRETQFQMQEP